MDISCEDVCFMFLESQSESYRISHMDLPLGGFVKPMQTNHLVSEHWPILF